MRMALFYGSTTGNTARVADAIANALGREKLVGVYDVLDAKPTDFVGYDVLIVGIPTWHVGDVQDDWATLLPTMADLDLKGTRVAFFGLGDSSGYPDTFGDALAEGWETFRRLGAQLVGTCSTEGYTFDGSRGLYDPNHFLGLMIDEDGESDRTEERIADWAKKLSKELAN